MLEMMIIAGAGIVLAASGLAFGKLGWTPLSKAMLVLLVISGLLCAVAGFSGYFMNQRPDRDYS